MHYVVLFSSKSCVTLNRLVSLVRELSQNTTEYYAFFCSVDQLTIPAGVLRRHQILSFCPKDLFIRIVDHEIRENHDQRICSCLQEQPRGCFRRAFIDFIWFSSSMTIYICQARKSPIAVYAFTFYKRNRCAWTRSLLWAFRRGCLLRCLWRILHRRNSSPASLVQGN